MKTPPNRAHSALSLAEVLVVLALLIILAVLLFPCPCGPRAAANRQLAATHVRNVVNACRNYKEDYGHYPQIEAAKDGTPANPFMSFGDRSSAHCKIDNRALLDVLRAIDHGENKGHVLNPKQTKYYEGPKAIDPKHPRDGFVDGPEFDSSQQGRLMDPWGVEYCFVLETDKDETLDLSSFYSDLAGPAKAVHFGAVGICLGKDGQLGSPTTKDVGDDIVSWR